MLKLQHGKALGFQLLIIINIIISLLKFITIEINRHCCRSYDRSGKDRCFATMYEEFIDRDNSPRSGFTDRSLSAVFHEVGLISTKTTYENTAHVQQSCCS